MEQVKAVRTRTRKKVARVALKKNKTTIVAEPGKQELIQIREFDAPRELVFKAHIDADLYAQWLGPRGLTTKFEQFEPTSGGFYRFIQTDKDGKVYSFHGVYHDVLAPERIIATFEYEGLPESGHVLLETNRFEKLPENRTRVIVQDLFQSVADRDGMLAEGMESGINEGFERLDEVLDELQHTVKIPRKK